MEFVSDTIGRYLERVAAQMPSANAVTYAAQSVDYAALDARVNAVARGLMALGFGKGTHAGLTVRNRPNDLYCLYALLRIGAVAVLVNANISDAELRARLFETDTALLLDTRPEGRSAPEGVCRIAAGTDSALAWITEQGRRVSRQQLRSAAAAVGPEDPDVILFTSGTLKTPKAVVTTHGARLHNALSMAEENGITAADRYCIALPMNHCFCLTSGVFAAMSKGACVCFSEDHHSVHILETIRTHRCTVLHGVPTMFLSALRRLEQEGGTVDSLRTGMIGGAGYTPEQFQNIARRLNFNLLPSLGQTEATAAITVAALDDTAQVKAGTVGHLMPGLSARFCDPATRRVLPEGAAGELCIHGYSVMRGYYRPPAGEAGAIDADGFLHTGDLGRMDAAGNITLLGRCKEIVIRGGENISPNEVDAVFASLPGVGTVKTVGVPDTHFGEELCTCIVQKSGMETDSDALRRAAEERLPAFKVPKHILFLSEFPYNATGKLNLEQLKKAAAQAAEKGLTR